VTQSKINGFINIKSKISNFLQIISYIFQEKSTPYH